MKQGAIYDKCSAHLTAFVLCPKVLQRILRDSGCLLASALSFDGFNALGQMVSARYQDMKLYKDSVDIRMVLADVAISTDVENKNSPLTYLAESIEAAKWYSEAAELYIGINEHRNFKEGGPSKALLHDHAGLAFKRAQNFVRAEQEYLSALREHGSGWHWSNQGHHACHVLEKVLNCYDIVCKE